MGEPIMRNQIHRPAEIFCYPPESKTSEAIEAWKSHYCIYQNKRCDKKSEHVLMAESNIPFGCCSVHHKGKHMHQSRPHIICPKRLEERGLVFNDAARTLQNPRDFYTIREINVRGLGRVDFFLVNYDENSDRITDFCAFELMTVSTTNTGGIIRGLLDHIKNRGIKRKYKYGINYRQVLGRMESQFFVKGKSIADMGKHIIWAVQDVLYDYLVGEYKLSIKQGFNPKNPIGMIVYTLDDSLDGTYVLRRSSEFWGTIDDWKGLLVLKEMPDLDALTKQLLEKLRSNLKR